jgi:hypothetical protein
LEKKVFYRGKIQKVAGEANSLWVVGIHNPFNIQRDLCNASNALVLSAI